MAYSQEDTARWLAGSLSRHEKIARVAVEPPNVLRIERKSLPDVKVVVLSRKGKVDADSVAEAVGGESVDFAVNVPKDSYLSGEAISFSRERGFALGHYGELFSALNDEDVASFIPKNIQFIERGLRQHTRVEDFSRLAEFLYLIRREGLPEVRAVFLHEYELTAEHVRQARDRYGIFDMVVKTNPNGGISCSASDVGEDVGARVYRWGEFLGALNRAK